MKKTKKMLAIVAAMAMALAPTSVFADTTTSAVSPATGGGTSSGGVEGVVKKEVFSVVLPTSADNTFDFILDPQDLINETGGTVNNIVTGASVVTEGAAGVYFKNGSGYAASSDALTVTNNSSMEVNVSVSATMSVSSADSVTVVTDSAVVESTSGALNLYVGIKNVSTGAVDALEGEVSSATGVSETTVAGLSADNFEIVYDATKGDYVYQPKADAASGESVSFVLEGACNMDESADWTSAKDMAATLDVVWTVTKGGATEGIALLVGNDLWIGPDANDENATFGDNPQVTSVTINGKACEYAITDNYIAITWAQIVAAGVASDSDAAFPWSIRVTVNGKDYVMSYTE